MILIGGILIAVALVLGFGGVFGVYTNISFRFDNLMKVIATVIAIVGYILLIE